MSQFFELLISGLSLGCIYGLIAMGFVIVFKASNVVNFAHASVVMLGAYLVAKWHHGLGFFGAIAVAAVVWGAALLSGRGRHVALPLIVVSGLTTIVLVVDQWLGAPLSFAGTFGYSPLYGARYYGIGNEMAGLLLGSAMVACALVLDT